MTTPTLQHGWLHATTTDSCIVAIRAESIDIIAERAGAGRCVITTRGGTVEIAADERDVRRLLCYPPAQERLVMGPWVEDGATVNSTQGADWVRRYQGVDAAAARVYPTYNGEWGWTVGIDGCGGLSCDEAKALADRNLTARGWALP